MNLLFKTYRYILYVISLFYVGYAVADELSLGAAVGVHTSPYKQTTSKVLPLPVINYDSKYLFFHGLGGGLHLYKDEHNEFNFLAEYSPMEFKPGDSDDESLKRLNKRKSTMMSGISFIHRDDRGLIHADFKKDVLGNSHGMTGDLGYDYRFEWNDIEITPGAGFMWNSKKQNDYYYGISSQESSRSGLKAYDPNDSFSPYLQLALDYPFAKSWKASVTARYTVLSSEVKNSPMVDKSGIASLGVDILYTF
jgi:outer membrane protein